MYKSRLQELCHQRLWALPEYTSNCEGSDHNPRFRAAVTVNGLSFHAADLSKTSKEAQNKAAQAAFEHFASAYPAPPPLRPSPSGSKIRSQNHSQCEGSKKGEIFMELRDNVK
uniref:Double-stranded RNA-binding protein 1-like n=1 Tax=Elaeis guineensis var. tenera TaxID=51953 RepID=A0A6I9QND3_ELAGV|nr:double-stranded RNA-binding protein 1-like [Elaeis guineensis]